MTGTNGIDTQTATRWLGEALRVFDALDAQKIDNMNKCRDIRSRLPVIYESAKNAGLPVRAFKLVVKQKLIERKIDGLQEDIEELKPEDEDDAEAFEMLQEALGEFAHTPLGAATLDAAADKQEKAAARKAAKQAEDVSSFQAETDAIVAANTEALEGENGIRQLTEDEAAFEAGKSDKLSRRQRRSEKLDTIVH